MLQPLQRVLVCLGLLMSLSAGAAAQDVKGGRDHPAFSRMPGFYLDDYAEKQFAAEQFSDPAQPEADPVTVEGHAYYLSYLLKKGATLPSELQITRNYGEAAKKAGGLAHSPADNRVYLKLTRGDKELWARVEAHSGGDAYRLIIVERQPMVQEVVADAAALARDLGTAGRVPVYGIFFDFDQAVVKPESAPALQEIARLLAQQPRIKLFVVGHTDNVGNLDHNLKLSQARAQAVVKSLASQHHIDAARLQGFGVGPLAPVASNQTEPGRARNRRVELVEQ